MTSTMAFSRATLWGRCRANPQRARKHSFACRAERRVSYPADPASRIEEPAARQMMDKTRLVDVQVEGMGSIPTAVVSPESLRGEGPLFVLLHGFDSSLLEFRRFHPLVAELGDAYAVDLVGWGFTDCGAASNRDVAIGPQQKRQHLRAFLRQVQQQRRRPVVLIGCSLGGAIALDYAIHYPEEVERLVLVDPQGFIDGLGLMPKMPRFLLELGCQVLQSDWLRESANQMAYHDKQRCATPDAMKIGQLHTLMPGWLDANIAFMRSGGYSISSRIPEVRTRTLVVWGRNDEILDPANALRFMDTLPNAELAWVEECGHCAHLEKPEALQGAVAAFVSDLMQGAAAGARAGAGQGQQEGSAVELQGAAN